MTGRVQTTGLILATVVAFFAAGWLLQRNRAVDTSRYARLFEDIIDHVDTYYVDSLDRADLYQLAIEGLIDRLGDPYADFLDSTDTRAYEFTTRGDYGGLGIEVDVRDGWITVMAPFPDSPAARAGIRPGDRITGVDGRSTEGWSADRAVMELRGRTGTIVTIRLQRPATEPFDLEIERADIHVSSVRYPMMLEGDVGYVQLTPVRDRSAAELAVAVDSLVTEGMTGLILDLRANPGGVLTEAINTADLFLDPGDEIVAQRGRVMQRTYRGERQQAWPDLELVVLVNQFSASAAEIVAGALQDHDRALILGQRTFGKGLVQGVFQLREPRTALKLTTARWYTPSGRSIHRPRDGRGQLEAEFAVVDTFRTGAGRVVSGGGGIIPDLESSAPSLTDDERVFFQSLGGELGVYRGILTGVALELVEEDAITPTFVATREQADEVIARMRRRDLSAGDVELTSRMVSRQLEIEVLRFAFGGTAARRRQLDDDADVLQASRLLQRADSPAALLELAESR